MAFLFSGSSSTSDNNQNDKQNIFAAPGGTPDQQQQLAGGTVEKSSLDGGAISSAPTTQSAEAPAAAPKASGGYNPKAMQSSYSRIANNLTLPTQTLSTARSKITDGQQKLQDEANKYGAAATTAKQGYGLDDTVLQQAAAGDKDAYQKTAQRLTRQAPEFEAFAGLGSEVPNIQNIRDTRQAYAPEAGPSYSQGQSRLDSMLLRRNPAYIQQQQQLLADEAALKKQNDESIKTETESKRADLGNAYSASTDAIKNKLGTMSGDIISSARAREAAEDARRGGLDASKIADKEVAALKAQVKQDLAAADPRSEQYRSAKYLDSLSAADLAKYVSINKDTKWEDFIGSGEADRYNRLSGLLGSGQMLTPSSGGPASDYEFDKGGAYKDILAQLTNKRQAADRDDQMNIDLIRKGAENRAKSANQTDSSQDAWGEAQRQLAAYARAKYSDVGDLAQLHAQDLFDGENLSKLKQSGMIHDNSGAATWQDILTADEASRLNSLTQDMGGLESYSPNYKPEFDLEALKKYYDQYVTPYMQKYRGG